MLPIPPTTTSLVTNVLRGLQGFVVVFDVLCTIDVDASGPSVLADNYAVQETASILREIVTETESLQGTLPAPPIAVIGNRIDRCRPSPEHLAALHKTFKDIVAESPMFDADQDFSFHTGCGYKDDAKVATEAVAAVVSRLAIIESWRRRTGPPAPGGSGTTPGRSTLMPRRGALERMCQCVVA